jgi:hypothetical protein
VRSRLIALAAAGVLVLTGCSEEPHPAAAPPAPPGVEVVEPPAASAGGACVLWDYAFIEDKTGVRFTVAAGDQVDDTATCVVQTENGSAPSLVLTVVGSTRADAALFTETLMPKKATRVKGLGRAGYRLVRAAGDGTGPSIEVGWLSEAQQLQSLKFTFAPDAPADAVGDMVHRLVDMAKIMSTTDGDAKSR